MISNVRFRLFLVIIGAVFLISGLHGSHGKIALLFLTREELNQPSVWEALLCDARDKYSLYVHSKEPMNHPFFKEYRIPKIVPTTWSVHVRAWQELLSEALKDPNNEKFVFVSEACVPMYTLNYIYDEIIKDPYTHMAYGRPWWPSNGSREVVEVDPKHRYGNFEWMVLNRKHAELVAKDRGVVRIVSRHVNDQESYFPILFSIYNCLDEVCNHTYTYANWEYAVNNGANPYLFDVYDDLARELLEDAYNIGCLFLRKVSRNFPEDVLMENILNF